MADNVMTFRLVVREIGHAARASYATFMPKPLEGVQGSGMHTHMTLFEGDENAFHDAGDPYGLSKVAKGFIAGLLRHAPEITAVTNQLVNSYKRLIAGFEAPVYVTLGPQQPLGPRPGADRQARQGRRRPASSTGRPTRPATRTWPSRSCWPPGCRASRRATSCRPRPPGNLFELTAEERAAEGIDPLPQSLSDALDAMERSELVAETLGEHIFEWFLRNKRAEWVDYKTQVTPFELDRYLPDAVSEALHGTAARLPRPAAARAGPGARPRRLPVEGGRVARQPPPGSSPTDGWAGAVVGADARSRGGVRLLPHRAQAGPPPRAAAAARLRHPARPTSSCATTCSTTSAWPRSTHASCEARLKHLFWRTGRRHPARARRVRRRSCSTSRPTRPSIAGRPLDLTYMEYELLKFLAQHPGKVFTREILLSRVWGYEYYGGARTVDVHIRRLRAKLGEEHANLIQTVRSVGYRFGQSRWSACTAGSHLMRVVRAHG